MVLLQDRRPLYKHVIPVLQFFRPCNTFKSVRSMFPCYTHIKYLQLL